VFPKFGQIGQGANPEKRRARTLGGLAVIVAIAHH
jgi:hypothetical protein